MVNKNQLEISKLPYISDQASEEFKKKQNLIVNRVNDILNSRDDINRLIGFNSLSVMHELNENNGKFMSNIFQINDYQLFKRTLPWIYKAYHNQGFSYKYFQAELTAWIQGVQEFITSEKNQEIIAVYEWILANHEKLKELSRKKESNLKEIPDKWEETYNQYLQSILAGNHLEAKRLYQQTIDNKIEAQEFFEHVIKNALYQVGELWETGKVSIAEEHMASSISSRVLSDIYMNFLSEPSKKSRIVVTSIANEFHEIGGRIIADTLEFAGWDVKYLGADTPIADLIELLKEERPLALGLSVSMSFNLENLIKAIEEIKAVPELEDMKILVGGKVLNENPGLWEKTGADAWARDSEEAVELIEKWWQEEFKL